MKKNIIALSGLFVLAFFVVFLVSAKNSDGETKKAATEAVTGCAQSCSQTSCAGQTSEKVSAECDPAKCKDSGCDPASCTGSCTGNCSGSAQGTAAAMACDPSACSKHALPIE